MPPSSPVIVRRTGMVLFLALLGLIVVGALLREPWPFAWRYWFSRWPLWVLVGGGVPLVVLRVITWRRRTRERQAGAPPRP